MEQHGGGWRIPEVDVCRDALLTLLHDIPDEQRTHAGAWLLWEVEALYGAAGRARPGWISALRLEFAGLLEPRRPARSPAPDPS